MADEPTVPPLEDAKEKRDEAFAASLGISRFLYFFDIRNSIAHALGTPADANSVPWRLWGARNIGGRIRSLAQNPRKPEVLYAGSAQGGVFKSADSGDTWLPLGGPANALPVGALAVTPSDTNIVFIGTGEAAVVHSASGTPATLLASESFAVGVGVIRFDERVGVFAPEAGTGANSFFRIAADPNNADRCWLATPTGLWRRETGPAYSRENMFAPAAAPAAGAIGAAVSDVVISPNADGSTRVLAAVMGVGIFRGRFTAVPLPATVWEPRLTRGLPDPMTVGSRTFDRISLAVCASQPNHVYAILETAEDAAKDRKIRAVYHSRDGGTNWTERSVGVDLGGQTWVNLVIAVHPDNPALVIIGAVDLGRSFDYGKSWHRISYWPNFNSQDRAQHGDQHAAMFDVVNPHQLWVANDGGISVATDIVQSNPLTDRTWRKRSDGLVASQFNDITVHPQFPFIAGGGLQDNATWVSFGGRTWFPVGDADGGEMAFEVRNPRSFIAPNQEHLAVARVVPSTTEDPTPGRYPLILRSPMNADQTNYLLEMFAVNFSINGNATIPEARKPLFVPIVEKHPTIPGHLLVGREGDAFFSTDFGTSYSPLNVGMPAVEAVSSLAYGGDAGSPPAPLAFWVGTNAGHVWRGVNSPPPTVWTDVTPLDGASPPAPIYGSAVVTRILVHPANPNYVVFATGRGSRGRVFLSMNQGGTWSEISGLTAASTVGTPPPVPGGPVPAAARLPPCPVTSLAFDTSAGAALPQTLYAGTLAGVFVIRGLPPATAAAITAFHPRWRTFNGPTLSPPGLGQLPLTLVNNLVTVRLNGNPLAPAGSPERVDRHRLIVALYGRGMHACDITPATVASPPYPAGGPAHRFFIRQHLIEDGLTYPRPTPTVLNTAATPAAGYLRPELGGDPRFPAGMVSFDDVSAWDIRADNAPFQFFEDVLDGVEFDTELRPKNLVAGERNIVYVQVQTAGWGDAAAVQVHLFFAEVPPASPLPAAPGPNLQADFWATFRAMPLSPPGAPWARASTVASVAVHPNDPTVVRFDWLVPKDLGGKVVGLLAICEHPALDPIPAVMPVNLATVIRQERRAAYRRVAVTRFTPDVYVRDSVEDDGTLGAVAFGGRSPDIMVVPARPVDRVAELADLLDARAGDRMSAGPATNFIYVRVHNRRDVEIRARVDMFFVKPASPALPPFNPANWTVVAAISPPAAVEVTVPPRGSALVEFEWNAAPAPDAPAGVMPSLGLIAFVQSAPDAIDPHPIVARVSDVKSFWRFFRALADSNNAAFRMVLYR